MISKLLILIINKIINVNKILIIIKVKTGKQILRKNEQICCDLLDVYFLVVLSSETTEETRIAS